MLSLFFIVGIYAYIYINLFCDIILQAKNIYLNEEEETDAITGLHQKTHYGRPQWDSIFKDIALKNPG